ncbi:MAG: polysaccharide deacetylase family protein [Pseudomonadota bacterium]
MFDVARNRPADLSALEAPVIMIIVDTEEDFDWNKAFDRNSTSVASLAAQHRAQEVFARHGVVPTYVVDYPVATSDLAGETLARFQREGVAEIGAHLHPWVNPPHEEEVNVHNSYPGNLPPALERAKLEILTEAITERFGNRPTVYKAGRYGAGPATGKLLEALGYQVDLSVVPFTSFAADGGPDFRGHGLQPYWFGAERNLLEIPFSCGYHGHLAGAGPWLYPLVTKPPLLKMRLPGILARLGLLERIRLTPEGSNLDEHLRLTDWLVGQGCRVFSIAYHSPSLAPGNTPYVKDETALGRFLDILDRYLGHFVKELGGRPSTPSALYRRLKAPSS